MRTANDSWMAARSDMQNPTALKGLGRRGTQLSPFTNEVLGSLLKATNELWSETSGRKPLQEVVDAMQAIASEPVSVVGRSPNTPYTVL